MQAYIALGSNLNDPSAQVRRGAQALDALPDTHKRRCSSLYRTAPVGLVDQPDFINAVCEIDTALRAQDLLHALLEIERVHGRVRDVPGGPRTLDLDLLLYGDLVCHEAGLTLPHPRLHERAFVLYPLAELAPALSIPGRGPVGTLLAACAGQAIERLDVLVDE